MPFATTKTTTMMMMMMSLYCRRCIWCTHSTIACVSNSMSMLVLLQCIPLHTHTLCTHHTIYTHWNTCIIYHIWINGNTKWESNFNPQGDCTTCLPSNLPTSLLYHHSHRHHFLLFSDFIFQLYASQTPWHDFNFIRLSKWHNRLNIEMLMQTPTDIN